MWDQRSGALGSGWVWGQGSQLSHFWDQGLEFSLQNLVSLKQNTLRYDSENDLVAERASHFIWLKRDDKVWL